MRIADYCCGGLVARLPAEGEIEAAVVLWFDDEFAVPEAELEPKPGAFPDALPGPVELAGGAALCGAVPAGAGGRGAETPAMSDPSPSFCKLGASSLPVASIPFADWNFCRAKIVLASHLPLGSPW